VLLPVILIALALLAAAAMAYGIAPGMLQYPHGLELIMLARRLQWPLVTLSLLLCLTLLFLVISGKRRAWWLLGLAPVLALFGHRFATSAQNQFSIAENPPLLSADAATGVVADDDWVVGLVLDDQAYAFPFAELYANPLVIQSSREKRIMLMWSPLANCATAWSIDRDLHARELDIVSMPANALLVYNRRLGEFINGVTGKTPSGATPAGVRARINTSKMTWRAWRAANRETKVMALSAARRPGSAAPTGPVLPQHPVPGDQSELRRMVLFVPSTQPVAVPEEAIKSMPVNIMAGSLPVLVLRDPATGAVKAFDRRIEEDLMPRFSLNTDRRRKNVLLVDADTNTGWSAGGVAIDGEKSRRGRKLRPVDVEEDVYLGVMKFWYPNLQVVHP
jgi:hypothetical protein